MRVEFDPDELLICERRGHKYSTLPGDGWLQCKWCGLWIRSVNTIEEQIDEPPLSEQSVLSRL